MNHNGMVPSSLLDLGHLSNHVSDALQVRAVTVRSPVGHMYLLHLVALIALCVCVSGG